MERTEIIKKTERLCDLLIEAKNIIKELENFADIATKKCNYMEFANVPIQTLPIPDKSTKTRFVNCMIYELGIKNLQDLLGTPYHKIYCCRNVGRKTIDMVKQTIKETYGVDWM